jgi:hypothetical protein
MKEPFELEWFGGPAEHFYRRARPDVKDVPWGTLDAKKYPPGLVEQARGSWTEVAINEYRAVAAFSEVVRCLVDALAPLDMIGMASDFLADEVLHVELASRIAMELGGAAPRAIDTNRFAIRSDLRRTAFERANEVVVRTCCVAEAFAGGIGAANMKVCSHPLTRAVYEIIMADEARHKRFGTLYLEWAAEKMTDEERARLAECAASSIRGLEGFWKRDVARADEGKTPQGWRLEDLHELGWLEAARAVPLARDVVLEDVIPPLASFGIVVPTDGI